MANTTNLGLGKLAGTEKLKTFPSMQAENMDTLDTAIGAGFGKNSKPSISQSMKNLGGGMAVLCDNNTHAAIPAGHYAYVMNHGTLTEGLYQNLSGSQIAANATLSGSNLTAVSGGGLNSLYSNINSKIIPKYYNTEALTTVYNDVVANKVVQFSGSATFAATLTNNNCNNVINGTFILNESAGVVEGIAYATGASAIFIMRIGSTGAISNLKKASLTSL